jgi:hypothetical protein
MTNGRPPAINGSTALGLAAPHIHSNPAKSSGQTIQGGIMKMLTKVIVLIGLALFLANASFAQQVKTDYDRAANFSQYKTYSWEKVQTPDPLWVDRIKAAVDAALAAKGWTQVESGGDISIIAIEINRDHQTLNTYYDDFGGGRRWRGFGGFGESTTTSDTYTVGTLVVDLFDAKTKNLVWRGVSSGMLSDKSDKNIKSLNRGVQKLFQHFPPDALKNS